MKSDDVDYGLERRESRCGLVKVSFCHIPGGTEETIGVLVRIIHLLPKFKAASSLILIPLG
jgi:hypothetical protein